MAHINLIYCSICTALFTTLGRPGQDREEVGRQDALIAGWDKRFEKGTSRKISTKRKE